MTAARPRKQVLLGAHFPGVNNTTVWSDPAAGSQMDFASFVHLAQTAERGMFDFFFLAEGLRLREQRGRIHDLDVVGRPDTLAILAAIAGVTTKLGLVATLNATYHEAYELARQLSTLDHLSGGRAGWNVVTSSDAFTGENFRRGGFLDYEDRYVRAGDFVRLARQLWDAWADDELLADAAAGRFTRTGPPGAFEHRGPQFDVRGHFPLPRSPQRHPVVFQAGDSSDGRELAAATADVVFSRHSRLADGQAFYEDVKSRLARYGRDRDDLKITPAATYVLGDTPADASERAHAIRRQQVSPQTAILLLEQVWNRDLSAYDPDGPLPDVDPDVDTSSIIQGRARMHADPLKTARDWRERAAAKGLGIRDLIIDVTGRQSFIGTPGQVADQIDEFVQLDGADGVILVPHITPHGLDDFVERVVPLLQERGSLRTEYGTDTLRDHLGLRPAGSDGGIAPVDLTHAASSADVGA